MKSDSDIFYRYPGTKPFEANESPLFKGRDEDIKNLYELISIQSLIVLYGRSGLGKSSLLNAGLTQKLKDDTNTSSIFVRFGTYYKGNKATPLEKLNEIITEQYKADYDNFLFQKLMPAEKPGMQKLWYLFKSLQIKNSATNTFILIFDQFEELFTYQEKEIGIFKKELSELFYEKLPQQLRNLLKDKLHVNKDYLTKEEAALLFAPLSIKIIFSIRSDKLSLLNNLRDFFPTILKSCYELLPLNRAQARQAIEIPAQLTDKQYEAPPYAFEDDTMNVILDSLTSAKKPDARYSEENQGIETFQLQIVCKHVEKIVIQKKIKIVSQSDLGNIKEIFENYYTNIIDKLSLQEQLPARKLIEEKLIIDGSRVCMPVSFLLKDMEAQGMTTKLLDELINTHILRPEHNNAVEISHDTLIEPILKSLEKRAVEKENKKQARLRVIVGIGLVGLIFAAGIAFFKYTNQQAVISANKIAATENQIQIDSVKANVLDSIVDRKKIDSLAIIDKADSLLKILTSTPGKLTAGIEIQYRCYNKQDADSTLISSMKNLGYANTHWTMSPLKNAHKPNALFYGSKVSLNDLKVIALTLVKAGFKLQRIADIRQPLLVQIWTSPNNMSRPPLTVSEVVNADTREVFNRGSKID